MIPKQEARIAVLDIETSPILAYVWSLWKVNVGLWLYDLLARGRGLRSHRMLSARRALALEPGLQIEGFRAAGLYTDCSMDDARVCLANILQAMSFDRTGNLQ